MLGFLRRPQVSIIHNIAVSNFFGGTEEVEDSSADKDTIDDQRRRLRNQASTIEQLQKEKLALGGLVRELARISNEQENILIEKSEHTGFCGCDLEKRASIAVAKARELVGGV
ncbi:hypothetical protein [Shinella zoogloeoides]|uniref:hypothetical protein n=1 Tax=Shinella zoogloeoides TaxID=352475 RepID=UPI00273EA89A|nr:hypothetical protein [Shinella zoogloeoides]WLR90895.1 hypothetical protein Q9316_00530 [Shinella zoogloeoides]